MAFLAPALPILGGLAGAAAGQLLGGPPKAVTPPSAPTRDIAAEMARRDDLRRKRPGAGGNIYAGNDNSGASTPAAKQLVGPGG